ncbi:MAG: hypothetical protein RBT74_16920 [Tenuifilaceae bacterium]|jgi:hypothetical protein|nr:hypothetical protein [Tenuifilaceae bacterium]
MESYIETISKKQIRFDEKVQIPYQRVEGLGDVGDILNSFEILLKGNMLPRKLSIINDSIKA